MQGRVVKRRRRRRRRAGAGQRLRQRHQEESSWQQRLLLCCHTSRSSSLQRQVRNAANVGRWGEIDVAIVGGLGRLQLCCYCYAVLYFAVIAMLCCAELCCGSQGWTHVVCVCVLCERGDEGLCLGT